ncbi:family 65 glycosyl hydrolase domain-containing protein [Microbacterium thalassium]|uniref:Maltose phosphorylase n=1 Tax=Microbacterium thalassium TaxID=362649 RepID=A0A7X0FQ46_9MICO|nr:family 65 glycosyl hydrolase domain-containing protein [Microbacterium thalassium]MBB6391613.1 maltose phosphorylase [Microbacterium thalassium]GLK24216.1 maltose phosphorylase [Microbacterium thalassium]
MSDRVFDVDPYAITTTRLADDRMRLIESMTSTGNAHMGMRGNFEEGYSGDTHRGTYIAGVWFPDKTRVGWWKNGYPEYFGKVINATNIIAVDIEIDGEKVDLFTGTHDDFRLRLDLRNGLLERSFVYATASARVHLEFARFLSIETPELLLQRVRVTVLDGAPHVRLTPRLDGDVHNLDANYGEQFWSEASRGMAPVPHLSLRTIPNPFGTPQFTVTAGMTAAAAGLEPGRAIDAPLQVGEVFAGALAAGGAAELVKTTAVVTTRDIHQAQHVEAVARLLTASASRSFEEHLAAHTALWEQRWARAQVVIEGDDEAQQGIQFNLFQLFSTYYGEDERLNIGPKGFTGEKYGGATYWDTEAYLVPLYLALASPDVTHALLRYRHRQLPQAGHNARQQGLAGALYPMVTFNGIECHNEWEITFEEIHRNGAMAHAIYLYTRYTGDRSYLEGDGLEVLVEISRFWADRVHFSRRAGAYMIHGVTGPNEYENNVNNNWYTNYLAAWVLAYTSDTLDDLPAERAAELGVSDDERTQWRAITENMYLPVDEAMRVNVQHDTFLDKDLRSVDTIPADQRPLNQNWSWDRILRSCFIKQADVLQGMYLFEEDFSTDELRRNFEFYEPMTVHESSLSASIHAIVAAAIGKQDKAIELYRRTARLDLDNYNNDTEDGLHITSMSGAWLSIVQGFAGMRATDAGLAFAPFCPADWTAYSFTVGYRDRVLAVRVAADRVEFTLAGGEPLPITVFGEPRTVDGTLSVEIPAAG